MNCVVLLSDFFPARSSASDTVFRAPEPNADLRPPFWHKRSKSTGSAGASEPGGGDGVMQEAKKSEYGAKDSDSEEVRRRILKTGVHVSY